MTDTDNLSKCDGCGPNGCACSTNEHHTNNNDYPMPRPVDLSQSHSSNFSETASSNYSHYSDTSKSSFGQITSYSPTADMDMSDQYPPTKRQRSDELGDEELMRMVYNTVTSMPSTSQCGCSSGGGCGAGCGQGCKGCNMPTSATSTSSADAMNQETSGGCCSPDNGCNSTIGNPRRPPYRNIKGELTCSCGCEKASQDCTDCFEDLCEG
ncbi:hypothetical protein BDF19DRAFT_228471 [Syncephalis fuscata]|nr:hypothetical protein BDF19DRAFT_228471 [Syncephalis fuscata]